MNEFSQTLLFYIPTLISKFEQLRPNKGNPKSIKGIYTIHWPSGQRIWQLDMRTRVRFLEFSKCNLRIRSGTGSTHPREDNWLDILIEKQEIWLRKPTLIDLTEWNINQITPSYCNLPVSYRNVVHQCGFLRRFIFNLSIRTNISSLDENIEEVWNCCIKGL